MVFFTMKGIQLYLNPGSGPRMLVFPGVSSYSFDMNLNNDSIIYQTLRVNVTQSSTHLTI